MDYVNTMDYIVRKIENFGFWIWSVMVSIAEIRAEAIRLREERNIREWD